MSSQINDFTGFSAADSRYYTGKRSDPPTTPVAIPISLRHGQSKPSGYIPDEGLVNAINVALILGQPLLLTGEPGTGKTQFAYSVANELGFGLRDKSGFIKPLVFETKSTTTSRDLFYNYDALSRFHAAQTKTGSQRNVDYINYNALGMAILRSREESEVKEWLPEKFEHGGRHRSVVLIDEIDKAPRDFPNDILNEIEHMYFKVPELDNKEFK